MQYFKDTDSFKLMMELESLTFEEEGVNFEQEENSLERKDIILTKYYNQYFGENVIPLIFKS